MVVVLKCHTNTAARVGAASFAEIWMHAGLLGGDAAGGIVVQHHFEEVEASFI